MGKRRSKLKLLVVDDEPLVLKGIERNLREENYEIVGAGNGEEALEFVKREHPALVLTDVYMPVMGGIEALKQIKTFSPRTVVVVMSGHGQIELAVRAMREGAFDFVAKPFDKERLVATLKNAADTYYLQQEVHQLREELAARYSEKQIIGISPQMEEVRRLVRTASTSDVLVMIRGESGTGKELVARAVHFSSDNKGDPFVAVNCAAIPATLIESELFGHEKGAFTGANQRRVGKFEQAGRGTIFLDEIGDLALEVQAKLLRVLQERVVTRIGGMEEISVNARIITATHRNLEAMVEAEEFRQDLYYRLNVLPIEISPMRERIEDIPLLCEHFLHQMQDPKGPPRQITASALEILCQYEWPGNVRELRNVLERAFVMSGSSKISAFNLDFLPVHKAVIKEDIDVIASHPEKIIPLAELERMAIAAALKATEGNVARAARELGVGRDTLYRKMRSYKISPQEER